MPDINVNKLSEALNTKADIDLNNTGVFSTSEGGGVNLTSSTPANASGKEVTSADFIKSNLLNYTTNRILEIPQDIKLELVDGTLTLKAGSKVYVPNEFESDGTTPKFDVVTIESDIQAGGLLDSFTDKWVFGYRNNGFYWELVSNCFSGSTLPTQTGENRLGYNTTLNKFQGSINGGAYIDDICSFPIGIFSTTSGAITSIDQIFNGFGYIGSTIFCLPGIKCLIGNGRNPDGSCITKIEEITKVSIFVMDAIRRNNKIVLYNGIVGVRGSLWFDEQVNMCYNNATVISAYQPTAILGTFSTEATSPWNITEFNPLGVDSFVNSNASNFSKAGENYLSSLSMPSNKSIDLTLGASGTLYTAPANGWFSLDTWTTSTVTAYYQLHNRTSGLALLAVPDQEYVYQQKGFIPCKASDIVALVYANIDTTKTRWRFIYAQGEQ